MMRVFDNGAFFTVQCTTRDVETFASRWPCFGPHVPVTFEFDKRNGDLVGVCDNADKCDGAGILALSQDAQEYGRKRLGEKERGK